MAYRWTRGRLVVLVAIGTVLLSVAGTEDPARPPPVVSAAEDASGAQQPPGAAAIDISGRWTFTVSNIQSSCGPEAGRTSVVVIEQDGSELLVGGIGDPGEQWLGAIDGNSVSFGGDRAEGNGVTTATFNLLLDTTTDPWTMTGTETWRHLGWKPGSVRRKDDSTETVVIGRKETED